MSNLIFIKYLSPARPENLLKLRTFVISNVEILILMSKIAFMKFLPPVAPQLALEFLAWISKVNRHKNEDSRRKLCIS